MKRLLSATLLLASSCAPPRSSTPAVPDRVIDGVVWRTGDWTPDLPSGEAGTSLGYHRAVVSVDSAAEAIRVRIPWRRPDPHPDSIAVVFVHAASRDTVGNVVALDVSGDEGTFVFEPVAGPGEYHAWYMPYRTGGGYYPDVEFLPPDYRPAADWLAAVDSARAPGSLAEGRVVAIESIDAFHDYAPMEVAATRGETSALRERVGGGMVLFPEDRSRSIRMRHRLPRHWAVEGPDSTFRAEARPGEYFTFQVGVWAAGDTLADVRTRAVGFRADGVPLPDGAVTCFNTEGVDLSGQPFVRRVDVPAGDVQALWFGVDLPADVSGPVEGIVRVRAEGTDPREVRVVLDVAGARLPDRGFDDPARMGRLAWLNSTVGSEPDFVIAPYEPVRVSGDTLVVLGRRVVLGPTGLPTRITSRFDESMTDLGPELDILARPVELVVQGEGPWSSPGPEPRAVSASRAEWTVHNRSDRFDFIVQGAIEYDGMLDYRMQLIALEDADVADIRLPVAYEPEAATWMLGLGRRGGLRPASVDWTWNVENHQEGVWMGGVNRGLQYVLRDLNYVRPLNTNFYRNQPLNLPPSWYNGGRGGIRIREEPGAVVADNYSGRRHLAAGDTLNFHVRFLVTPFHALDTRTQFRTRFVHQYVPVDTVAAWGGTVVNIHHAQPINPYINYPFYALDEQKAYIDEAHSKGIKVKLYYTIRELTYRAYELFALRSLGTEIFNDGDGGGHPWLQEHLRDRYHAGWHAWRMDDASILDKGTSRWTNYYVEGLNWLAEHQNIDGLYLDDIAFSRETVKRMVSVLHRHRDEVVIDLHSANQYNVRDGWINSAMLYMEHFPYVSRLWFGEYFEYDRGPDYWLTEVSGIPFGLMGEMLQDGGHPYRGLLYGMTARKYGNVDPRPVWNMMAEFGIEESRMLGYWLPDAPVRTDDPDVLATTYLRPDGALVVLASWSASDRDVRLAIDWQALGTRPASTWTAPAVEGLQADVEVDPSQSIRVRANQGLFLLVKGRRTG